MVTEETKTVQGHAAETTPTQFQEQRNMLTQGQREPETTRTATTTSTTTAEEKEQQEKAAIQV